MLYKQCCAGSHYPENILRRALLDPHPKPFGRHTLRPLEQIATDQVDSLWAVGHCRSPAVKMLSQKPENPNILWRILGHPGTILGVSWGYPPSYCMIKGGRILETPRRRPNRSQDHPRTLQTKKSNWFSGKQIKRKNFMETCNLFNF